MVIKEIIEKIKIFLLDEIETNEEKLTDVKTVDDLILSFDTLEVGKELFVVDENGRTPAPDMEYQLVDGTTIVSVGGLITEIKPPEAPIEDNEIEVKIPLDKNVEMSDEIKLSEIRLNARINQLEEDNLELATLLSKLAESFSKKNFKDEVKLQMINKIEKPVNSQEPIKWNKNTNLDNIYRNMYK